jgi:cytochrome c553
MKRLLVLISLVMACASCGPAGVGRFSANAPPGVGDGPCASGLWWNGGTQGSGQMMPGEACVACHSSSGEGPRDRFMGTAYGAAQETSLCMAYQVPSGAVVEILDTNDVVKLTLPIDSSGNFYSTRNQTFTGAYKARVTANGKTNAMSASQTDGDCNTCHTAKGLNGAPGRVMYPQ